MPPEDFLERDTSRRVETLSAPSYYALQGRNITFSAVCSLPPGYTMEHVRRKLGIQEVRLKTAYSRAGFPLLGAYVMGSDTPATFNFAEINSAFKEIIYDYIWSKNPKTRIEDLVDISRTVYYKTDISGFTFNGSWAFPPVSAPSSPAFPGAPVQERCRLYRQEYDEYANHFITFLLEHHVGLPGGALAGCIMGYWISQNQMSIHGLMRRDPDGKFAVSRAGSRLQVEGFCREHFLDKKEPDDPDSSRQEKVLEFTGDRFRFFDEDGMVSGRSGLIPGILADYALHPRDGMVGEMAGLGFMDDVLERE